MYVKAVFCLTINNLFAYMLRKGRVGGYSLFNKAINFFLGGGKMFSGSGVGGGGVGVCVGCGGGFMHTF